MGHGHEHHGPKRMELPDYRMWKIEGTPLEKVQQKLAEKGLKDPWLRNEAWKFSGAFSKPVTMPQVIFRGFKWGFLAFAVSLGVEYAFFPPNKDDHH